MNTMKDLLLVYTEIHRNPFDLSIAVTTLADKYGFIITRGPGRRFAPLVVLHPCFQDTDKAVTSAVELLINIAETTQTFADEGETLPPLLTMDVIGDIQIALRINDIANTWQLQTVS